MISTSPSYCPGATFNVVPGKLKLTTPSAPPLEEEPPAYSEAIKMPQYGGGSQKSFNKIYHPELNRWVSTNSNDGIDALLKYAYYNA